MKIVLAIISLITVIACVPMILYAQESPIQFTIRGHQYRTGKTYTFPPEMQMLCNGELKDKNTTDITGTAQFPPDDPTQTVSLNIELFSGEGKTEQSLDHITQPAPDPPPGNLTITIMGPGGGTYIAVNGIVTIDDYGVVNGYLDGHFKATLETADANGNATRGYSAEGTFHVKRTQ